MKRFLSLFLTIMFLSGILFPSGEIQAQDQHPLLDQIISDAAIVVDHDTGQILDEKNPDQRIYPASMTKIMTAILVIENLPDLSQTVTITDDMLKGLAEENASVVGFQPGDTPTVQDLLYGIALPSGADASNAAAYTITGNNPSKFIEMMNMKAKELGMKHTNFVNDTGLHDENHYSTVRDMAKLLDYCLQNEEFRKIFSARTWQTGALASSPEGIFMHSTIWSAAAKEGYSIDGLTGGKTGYTIPAGHCLAAWADVNNMHLILITAHADTPIDQMTHIHDASTILNALKSWSKQTLIRKNETIATIRIHHPFHEESMKVKAPEKVTMDLPENSVITRKCSISKEAESDDLPRNLSGTITVTANEKDIYQKKLKVQIPAEKNIAGRIIIWFKKLFS